MKINLKKKSWDLFLGMVSTIPKKFYQKNNIP